MKKIVASIAALPFAVGTVFAGATNAQALVATGSLSFQDGTGDFFNDVNVVDGDTFDVDFNLGSNVFVSTAVGDFVPPFEGNFKLEEVATSTGSFKYVSGNAASTFIYELTNNLVFDFDNGDNDNNEATVTWSKGTQFQGFFGNSGVEFSSLANAPMGTVTGIGENVTVIADALQFADTEPSNGGSYLAQVDVKSAPEPTALFGLGVVATGLVASRRKKNA